MAFLVENERKDPCERKIRGRYREAAVDCWFPSTGEFYPRAVKYMDEEGEIQCLSKIQVLYWEQNYYAGVQARRFQCRACAQGRNWEFTLLFYPEEGTWKIVFPF